MSAERPRARAGTGRFHKTLSQPFFLVIRANVELPYVEFGSDGFTADEPDDLGTTINRNPSAACPDVWLIFLMRRVDIVRNPLQAWHGAKELAGRPLNDGEGVRICR